MILFDLAEVFGQIDARNPKDFNGDRH